MIVAPPEVVESSESNETVSPFSADPILATGAAWAAAITTLDVATPVRPAESVTVSVTV